MRLMETLSQSEAPTLSASSGRYQGIDSVLNDRTLDVQQKRAILSSWASDLWAIESCPWLREVPGVRSPLRVSDIFAALRSLDDEPPPRGGMAMRLPGSRAKREPAYG